MSERRQTQSIFRVGRRESPAPTGVRDITSSYQVIPVYRTFAHAEMCLVLPSKSVILVATFQTLRALYGHG